MDFSFSYAVFRYVKDAQKDLSVPVGVALWSPDARFVRLRLVEKADKRGRINKAEDLPYIDLAERQIRNWIEQRELPYQKESMLPESDQWWRHVRELLIHKIRLSEPLPIDCRDPESELEPLFASIVRQERSRNKRIDSVLGNALGDEIAKRFHRGPVEGFAGKPVHVMRIFKGATQDVVLDAVNLAADDAPQRADEIVGKLQRARLNGHGLTPKPRRLTAVVGYVSSPGGLNGEGYLKDWIEKAGAARAFDLRREQAQLRITIKEALDEASLELLEGTQ
jgi:Protein of unknown function (DUF3037)